MAARSNALLSAVASAVRTQSRAERRPGIRNRRHGRQVRAICAWPQGHCRRNGEADRRGTADVDAGAADRAKDCGAKAHRQAQGRVAATPRGPPFVIFRICRASSLPPRGGMTRALSARPGGERLTLIRSLSPPRASREDPPLAGRDARCTASPHHSGARAISAPASVRSCDALATRLRSPAPAACRP